MGPIEKSFELNLKIMYWCGYDPRKYSYWYQIRGIVFYILFTWVFCILATLAPAKDENFELEKLFDTLNLLPQMIILTIKIFPFLIGKPSIEYLLRRFLEDDFSPKLTEHRAIMERCVRECRRLSAAIVYFAFTSWIFWVTKPIHTKELLPFEMYFPFAVTSGTWVHYAAYFYTSVSVLYGAMSNCSLDSLISGLMYHASGQLKILKDKLATVGLRADVEVLNVTDFAERENRRNVYILGQMRENLIHYDNITRYVKELEKVFTLTPFIQLSVSTIVICMNCFRMIYMEPFSLFFLYLAFYNSTIIFQVYMFCHYGNELHYESQSVGTAIYMSDWYSFDKESRRMILMLMERAKKPVIFKAGKLLPLSVSTFVSIMKTTYSLLAVLQSTK